jgi:dihydrofolate reductase
MDAQEEAMRRIRYQVAMSLDGYIAGPNGEFDWIVKDPEILGDIQAI